MITTGNLVLDSVPGALQSELMAVARPCKLELGTILVRRGGNPKQLVFLTSGMASLVITMADGGATEVGMIGYESLTGISTLFGDDKAHPECIVQIPGEGLQIPRQHLLGLFHTSPQFREHILRSAQSQMHVSAQICACNLRHQAEGRFARWLLTASDRTRSDTLQMTQEFLAQMIGTRRTTVSMIVRPLHEKGYIRQRRGTIYIVDRPGLLTVACECYEMCRKIIYSSAVDANRNFQELSQNVSPATTATPPEEA